MDTAELLKKVRKIEIKSKGLSNQIFSGEYHSAFKGSGMAFSEVREYVPGDDIRKIDWNVTARFGHPFIKVFQEERELTVMLLIDISKSSFFGTKQQLKSELITEMAAVLAFSAITNNDKIGAILFTDRIEKFIAPKKGRSHILRIIREMLDTEPQGQSTDLNFALRYFNNVIKKKSTCFVLSDFLAPDFSTSLRIANRKHDLVALWIKDMAEVQLPNLGLIPFANPETGTVSWIDTSSKQTRKAYQLALKTREDEVSSLLKKSGVDFTQIATHESYVRPLMNLFKRRENKR